MPNRRKSKESSDDESWHESDRSSETSESESESDRAKNDSARQSDSATVQQKTTKQTRKSGAKRKVSTKTASQRETPRGLRMRFEREMPPAEAKLRHERAWNTALKGQITSTWRNWVSEMLNAFFHILYVHASKRAESKRTAPAISAAGLSALANMPEADLRALGARFNVHLPSAGDSGDADDDEDRKTALARALVDGAFDAERTYADAMKSINAFGSYDGGKPTTQMHGEIFACAEKFLNQWIHETFPAKDAVTGSILPNSRDLDAFFDRLISIVDNGHLYADLRLQNRSDTSLDRLPADARFIAVLRNKMWQQIPYATFLRHELRQEYNAFLAAKASAVDDETPPLPASKKNKSTSSVSSVPPVMSRPSRRTAPENLFDAHDAFSLSTLMSEHLRNARTRDSELLANEATALLNAL